MLSTIKKMLPSAKNTKKMKERSIWSSSAEDMLVELCLEKADKLRGYSKKLRTFGDIAHSLRVCGHSYDAVEVKMKVHNLKKRFRNENKKIACTGSASQWPLYDKVHQILSGSKAFNLSVAMEESIESRPSPVRPSTSFADDDAYISDISDSDCSESATKKIWIKVEDAVAELVKTSEWMKAEQLKIDAAERKAYDMEEELIEIEMERDHLLVEMI